MEIPSFPHPTRTRIWDKKMSMKRKKIYIYIYVSNYIYLQRDNKFIDEILVQNIGVVLSNKQRRSFKEALHTKLVPHLFIRYITTLIIVNNNLI